MIYVTSWNVDNLLTLKCFIAFWDGIPFVFFVVYMYGNSNKSHWLFFHWDGFYMINSQN